MKYMIGLLCVVILQTAQADTCPPGQRSVYTGTVISATRTLVVPGKASGMFSGVIMRKGIGYRISATGSIRVGVFGETGTPPEGWVPQGSAGPGFPSPSAYTYSLIYRIGRAGPWEFAGPDSVDIRLKPHHPDRAELYFAINDKNTNDNTGAFNVTVKEIHVKTQCRVPPPPPPVAKPPAYSGTSYQGGIYGGKPGSPSKGNPQTTYQPCAGKTANGQKQGFTFYQYCPGNTYQPPIPIEACTYAEARNLAQGFVHYGCGLR